MEHKNSEKITFNNTCLFNKKDLKMSCGFKYQYQLIIVPIMSYLKNYDLCGTFPSVHCLLCFFFLHSGSLELVTICADSMTRRNQITNVY